jgi:parallel beta helix pectate lyase-like protein
MKGTKGLLFLTAAIAAAAPPATKITVHNSDELRRALAAARPGSRILLAPGTYRGGLYMENVRGAAGRPIVVAAADPAHPPVILGGETGIQLSDPAYLELRGLTFTEATGNGLNINDGGTFQTPAHHIVLRDLTVTDVGPSGNRDGIKLSGVDDFRVENCRVIRWGDDGSAIDMVGCHQGLIQGCLFRHGDATGASGVQMKGGSASVTLRRCRFEHAGQRSVNLGGSTDLPYFRPKPQGYEGKELTVEGCTFIGSQAPFAFVGVDGATVRFNTVFRPKRWVLRILQETTAPGFVRCRRGLFTDNLVLFNSHELAGAVNIGPLTAPQTFRFARNWWYALDAPARSGPSPPTPEKDGVIGRDPQLRDLEHGDLRPRPGSPAAKVGAAALAK